MTSNDRTPSHDQMKFESTRCSILTSVILTVLLVAVTQPIANGQPNRPLGTQRPSGETQQSLESSGPQEQDSTERPSSTQTQETGQTDDQERRRRRTNWQRDFDGILRLHDPSTIVKEDSTYWMVHTGMGVGSIRSRDLRHWERGADLLSEMPDWVREVVPNHRGYYWAPDIIRLGDRYLVYFSVSSFGKNESAIGLISSPTLDPESSEYHWTDHGIVVRTNSDSDHNAIDPSVLLTPDGELWMAYGSFWSGLKMIQLNPETGLRLKPEQPPISVAYQEQIEAPDLVYRDGYYYLFLNWGWCCRGVNSTYNIRVGRSRNISGPFLDRDGVDLRNRGGTLVLDTHENRIGPGHPEVAKTSDGWRLTYHYYDADHRGRSRLGISPLTWDEEGWPIVDPADESLQPTTKDIPSEDAGR